METANPPELTKTFQLILSNRKSFWSFVSLMFIAFLFVITSVFLISNSIQGKADKIQITETGAIVIEMHHNREAASFLLSSNGGGTCSPWISTGIHICKGDKIKFNYSGTINIGMHKMMDAASKNIVLPPIPWTTAEGLDANMCDTRRDIRYIEKLRKKSLVNPNLPQGRLIGNISSTSKPEDRPKKIIDIPKFTNDCYVATESGILWLTINDSWLNSEFMLTSNAKQLGMESNEFFFIKNNDYKNVWYDDNSGFFNVTIEIVK